MDRMEAAAACGNGCGLMNEKTPSSFRLRCSSLRLRRVFDVFDNNGDAMITVNELGKKMSLMGLDAEASELDSLIRLYVKPGNEGLTYEDFMALYESLGDTYFNFGDKEAQRIAQEEEDLSEAFKVFDEDGDGYISAAELQAVLGKLGFLEGKEIDRVQQMIISVDRNQDGLVDFIEFKDMMRNALVVSTS